MAPLTSPGCDGCHRLSQRIVELEGRMSTLYQLRQEEHTMDSLVVTLGPAANSTSTDELDTTVPLPSPRNPAIPAAAHWSRLGAKPKALVNFTPAPGSRRKESWNTLRKSTQVGKTPCSPPTPLALKLSNRFSILEEDNFPPLKNDLSPPPSKPASLTHPSRQKLLKAAAPSRPGMEPMLGNPSHAPAAVPAANPVRPFSTSSSHSADSDSAVPGNGNQQSTTPHPLFSPTTLIVGDSIIRNVRFFNAATHCFPGSTVPVILDKLPTLLRSLPPSIKRVIVHVGSNDTSLRKSELTKTHFLDLLDFLDSCGKSVFISGPIPTVARGAERFSRILSLHTWLQSTCSIRNIKFIDNFNLFWNRSPFFKTDGLHPNRHGSRMLAANLQYTVHA